MKKYKILQTAVQEIMEERLTDLSRYGWEVKSFTIANVRNDDYQEIVYSPEFVALIEIDEERYNANKSRNKGHNCARCVYYEKVENDAKLSRCRQRYGYACELNLYADCPEYKFKP